MHQFRLAFLYLSRAPGTALVIVLTIAMGIAVTTAMIAFYNGMTSESIPHKSDRLFRVLLDSWTADEAFAEPDEPPNALTYIDAMNLMANAPDQGHTALYHTTTFVSEDNNRASRPIKVSTRIASHGFFSLFEPTFAYGNGLDRDGDDDRVVVISKVLNDRVFGGRNSIGEELMVNREPFVVVGVLDDWAPYPLYYDMTREDIFSDEIFIPFTLAIESLKLWPTYWRSPVELESIDFDEALLVGESVFVQFWVQLDTGPEQAEYRQFLDNYVNQQKGFGRFPRDLNNELLTVNEWVDKAQDDGVQKVFVQTLIVVGLLFFSVCLLNILTLMMSRFIAQTRTTGTLRALGAPVHSVFSQHLIEVGLMGLIGGMIGVVGARFALVIVGPLFLGADNPAAQGFLTTDTVQFDELLDSKVLVISLVCSIVGVLLAALYPIWNVCKVPPSRYLKSQ